MPGSTPNGFPYPVGSDPLQDGDDAIQALAEFIDGLWIPWTAYTPTFTAGVTIGNGTLTAYYRKWADQVDFWLRFGMGSTSAVTENVEMDVTPAGLNLAGHASQIIGHVLALDVSANAAVLGYMGSTGVPSLEGLAMDTTNPFTWANGDVLHVRGSYQVAP